MRARVIQRFLANASLCGLGLFLALGAGEIFVRRVAPQYFPLAVALRGLHVPDAELGYVMRGDFSRRVRTDEFACDVVTNSLGLRGAEIPPRSTATLRLLALGDSFTLGIHAGALDSCFVERLQAALSHELARTAGTGRWSSAEIVNAGVDGYGTEQEIGLLHRLAPTLRPDGVLLTFYLGNDFADNSGKTRMTVVDGYQMLEASAAGYRREFAPWDRKVRLWLHANSELYLLLKSRLVHPLRRGTANAAAASAAAPKSFDYYIYDKAFADAMRAEPSEDLRRALRVTRDAFVELRRWCDANGVAAMLVAIPAEQQVDATARARWLARFGLDATQLDFTRPNHLLAALAAEAGLPLVDLTAEFESCIAAGARPYLVHDSHWNATGHAIAARALVTPVLAHLAGPAGAGGH